MREDIKRHSAIRAIERVQRATESLTQARLEAEQALRHLHGRYSVRAIARETDLAAATVSNVLRGRLVVSPENALRILDAARAASHDQGGR